jgi:hypothetical protein
MRLNPRTTKLAKVLAITVAAAAFLLPVAWAGSKYKVLHNFGASKDGPGVPSGPLLLDGDGNLYGTTRVAHPSVVLFDVRVGTLILVCPHLQACEEGTGPSVFGHTRSRLTKI